MAKRRFGGLGLATALLIVGLATVRCGAEDLSFEEKAQKLVDMAQKNPNSANIQLAAQKFTIADMRNVATAMMDWQLDSFPDDDRGAKPDETRTTVDLSDYPPVSVDRLSELLVERYISKLRERDGWGNRIDFRLDLTKGKLAAIRSPGRDGEFDTDVYTTGAFAVTDYDQDIVWADGAFVRWPDWWQYP